MIAHRALFAVVAFAVFAAGCDNPPIEMDAGTTDSGTDAGPPDSGPPLACTSTMRLDGVSDDTVSVMLDTSMTEERPRDLGTECGNPEAELRWAPEQIIEFHVPGTGPVALELDTVFPETDATFNTVLQVRRVCEEIPTNFPPSCFDDAETEEYRSKGSVSAMGGDVLYIVVTGYSEPPAEQGTVDEGHVRLDVTVRPNSPPTVTSGAVVLALDDTRVVAAGNDPEGDARGVALNFLDDLGNVIDIYDDGTADADQDVFIVRFDPEPTTPDYNGLAEVPGAAVTLAAYLRNNSVPTARMRVFDSAFAMSAPFDVPIQEGTLVGLTEACDTTHVCRREMTCDGTTSLCIAPPAIVTACGAAIDLAIPAPTDTATSVTRMGVTGSGVGLFAPTTACVDADASIGQEAIYSFIVPDGTYDVIATTDLPGTADTDTILYLRSACPDSGTELACNDDRVPTGTPDYQSDIQRQSVGPGTYYLFVEVWGGLMTNTAPHELRVTLRPVLAAGAACDLAGVNNRCATGACAGDPAVCPTPPPPP